MENQNNNKKVTAVLLDTISIQKYIFSGRKLREFVGASYIVDWIYDEPLLKGLAVLGFSSISLLDWKNHPGGIRILSGEEFEVGYIGGGNALLFFRKKTKAEEFVRQWTLNLLYMAPGLIPSAVIEEFDFGDYKNSIKKIFEKLEQVKNSYPVNVFIPRHGISAECQLSGGAKEVYHTAVDPSESGYISSILKTKLNYADEANRKFEDDLLGNNYRDSYSFTTEIDKLGQRVGEENYIAIVHIDGNSTGKLFRDCQNLEETRRLSIYLKEKTLEAMKKTVEALITEINNFQNKGYLKLTVGPGKTILPVRPIIIGGDDVTFVSHGKLGIWLADMFIDNYHRITNNNSFNHGFTLSSGVLITKSHMPFFRAYQLSEHLCAEAKKRRRENNNRGSWIDFHLAYGGFTGTIKEIRERHYKTALGPLYLRPYRVDDGSSVYGFQELKSGACELKEIPRSKLMDLRKILAMGDEVARNLFLKNLIIRGEKLPAFPGGNYSSSIWDNQQTPYFDMIELIEIYPF